MKLYKVNGILQSVEPAEVGFQYSYFGYCLPPFKPESCLILGAGQGTIEKLIKKIWGDDVNIVGVDIKPPATIIMDARDFVELQQKEFDYVVVDIANGSEIPEWVFSEEFVKDLAKVTGKLLAINVLGKARDMSFYQNYFTTDLVKNFLDNNIWFFKSQEIEENEWFL